MTKYPMTKEEVLHFKLILAVLALRLFGFGYFGTRHLPNTTALSHWNHNDTTNTTSYYKTKLNDVKRNFCWVSILQERTSQPVDRGKIVENPILLAPLRCVRCVVVVPPSAVVLKSP